MMSSTRRLAVEHRDGARVARAVLDAGDARQPHDVAGARLENDGAVILRLAQLRVGVDGHRLLVALDDTDRGYRVGGGDGAAHLLHAEAHGGQQRGVDAHADRRLLGAADLHLRHARHLRDALGDDRVGGVVDGAGRHALRRHRQDEHRRGRRIVLAEGRHLREVARQVGSGGVERGLHVAGGAVDVARSGRTARRCCAEPCELTDVSSVTPAISPSRRSSGAAMVAAMVSGSAPGRLAWMRSVGKSIAGRLATGSSK